MLRGIEHVAVAVTDLDAALRHLSSAWGLEAATRERVDDQGVEEALVPLGAGGLQLVSPTTETSTVARFLARRGEGLHHVALRVDDLGAALEELRGRGVRVIDEAPRRGGGGHLVAFVDPRGNLGVLVELVQRAAGSASHA